LAYRIEVSKQARKYIDKLDATQRKRFAAHLDDLKKDPLGNSKALVNAKPPCRSSRVGDWRILLHIEEEAVIIAKVLPRGEVYKTI